jgi:TP901 family phage tail tape measure protein
METVSLKIKLVDAATKEIKTITAEVEGLTQAVAMNTKAASEASAVFGSLTDKLIKVQTFGESFGKIATFLSDSSAPAVDFQARMADLSAITGVVGEDLQTVADMARQIGKDSGLGASEAARAFTILAGQLDAPVNDIELILQRSATLAQAAGLSIDDAANSLAATISQYGLAATDAQRVMNVLAAGSREGAAEVVDLAASFKVVGAAASSLGVDVEHTAGALEVLAGANIKGAEAGTALRNILLSLKTKLGIDTNVTDLSDALGILKSRLHDTQFLATVFGRENITAATYLIQNADAVRQMTDAVTATSAAEEQAAIRNATWAHSVEVARANIEDWKISLGNTFGAFGAYSSILAENAEHVTALAETTILLKDGFAKAIHGISSFATLSVRLLHNPAASMRLLRLNVNRYIRSVKTAITSTKAWGVAQKAFNFIASMNPIGLIVIAITALVAGIVACITHFKTWGETVLECMGPVGWLIASIVRHWDSLKKAFTEGGFVAGIKRLGAVLLDALLHPMQKLLGWIAKLTGWDWAQNAADWVHNIRVDHELTENDTKEETTTDKQNTPDATTDKKPTKNTVGINTSLSAASQSATAGQSQIKRIDITIDRVVEHFNINTTNIAQNAHDIRDMVARALTDAVNDINYAI